MARSMLLSFVVLSSASTLLGFGDLACTLVIGKSFVSIPVVNIMSPEFALVGEITAPALSLSHGSRRCPGKLEVRNVLVFGMLAPDGEAQGSPSLPSTWSRATCRSSCGDVVGEVLWRRFINAPYALCDEKFSRELGQDMARDGFRSFEDGTEWLGPLVMSKSRITGLRSIQVWMRLIDAMRT